MPSRYYRCPFQIDHIISEQHGGKLTLSNTALACYHCNLSKGPNIAGKDPDTGRTTRLFHPRQDAWDEHFRWRGVRIVGRTAIGRTTVRVLDMNHPAYLLVRKVLKNEGLFPEAQE